MTNRLDLDCATADELASAYAIGAVDPDEERAVSEHLATCDRPHDEARAAVDAAAALAASLEPVVPSPGLRDRLMATVADTPQDHRPAAPVVAPEPAVVDEQRRPWWRIAPLATAVAAVAVVAAVGIGLWGLSLRGELNDRDAALEAVASADAIFAASGAAGTGWVVESGDQAMFMARDLAPLPSGSIYELWLLDADGNPTAVGTVTDPEGVALVTLDQALAGSATFAVTVETERVEAPTSDPVMVAPLDV